MVCGCLDVCTADDGMLTVARDEHRRDWAFELVSGLNSRPTMLGDTCEGVVVHLFKAYISILMGDDRRCSQFPIQLLYSLWASF